MFPLVGFFLVVFVALAIVYDLSASRIPNWLVLVGVLGGTIFNTTKGFDQLLHSLLGLGFGVGILILPFALGWLGAGDVKLLGAVGSILGASLVPRVFFYSVLLGGVCALGLVICRHKRLEAFTQLWLDLKLFFMSRGAVLPQVVGERHSNFPLGVAIGLGTLTAVYVDPDGKWAGF